MRTYSLTHVPDAELLRNQADLDARERGTTAIQLAHLGEIDARRLYLPEGYPSMYAWCVGARAHSEDVACQRIQAARCARRFPAIFSLVADGQLHLTAILVLSPYLTPENAAALLEAAAARTKRQIEVMLAERFPRTELIPMVQPLGVAGELSAPVRIDSASSGIPAADAPTRLSAPVRIDHSARPKLEPIAAQRYALQVMIGQDAHEKLGYAQALLGHALPSGDLATVIERALEALIAQLERRKFGASSKPHRQTRRTSANPRHIPAAIKRAVWERDGGRCTFSGESGHRCEARDRLEFDHVQPVARGGVTSVAGIRLRCRAHNQYEAERVFGAGFMDQKRQGARKLQAARRSAAEARAAEEVRRAAEKEQAAEAARARAEESARARAAADEVIPYLKALRFSPDEARAAAEPCTTIPDAPLEDRVRLALSTHGKAQRQRHARIMGAAS